jgi:hypothetical protein
MDCCILDSQEWAEAHFGGCEFGDKRLTKRLVAYAASAVPRPDAATPQQTRQWKDCKATYRFMDNPKVSFEQIVEPHCRRTREHAATGVWLSLCDTTEASFSIKRTIEGLGPVGNGGGRGFFLHTSFFVRADSDEIAGIGAQELFYRKPKPPGDTSGKRKKRKRESEVWGRIVDQVGQPASGASIIHVCDRAADDFEFYCHCSINQAGWIVRAQHLNRKIRPVDRLCPESPQAHTPQKLQDYVDTLPSVGSYELHLRANNNQPARIAQVEVRIGSIWVPRPCPCSPWVKKNGPKFIPMDVVEVREIQAPKNVAAVHWVLLTNSCVNDFEDAWTVIGYYEKRPLIEEYHKAAKTGCQIEERLYRTAERLERIVGVLSILAMRLVQMKSVARTDPERLASEVAPEEWVETLCDEKQSTQPKQAQKWDARKLNTRDFFRGIATLGGFLGRRSDGEPGWMTIWRGVKELLLMVEARRKLRLRYG